MKINGSTSTEATLKAIGERLLKQRLGANLTQASLAEKAGVSKRTIERIENGSSIQLSTLIQVLRVFNLLEGLDIALPEKASSKTKTQSLKEKKHPVPAFDKAPLQINKSRSWGFESRR